MRDPIVGMIHSCIISLCLSDPPSGLALSQFEVRQGEIDEALRLEGGALICNRVAVKSLTRDQLLETLVKLAKSLR